jgi:sensor domain CHASE-containing protein
MKSVFSLQDVEEAHLPLVHHVESNEVIGFIPYLSPELIAAILKLENISAVDLQADSKSATENSFPASRSQSPVNEKAVRVPFRWRASWLRCSRLFVVVGRLVVAWFT